MTIEIQLTKGLTAIVDEVDADLAGAKWYAQICKKQAYVARKSERKLLLIHRIILARILNRELLPGEICDHINSNGLDNRRSNLRLANKQQNSFNRRLRSDNISGLKGVTWHKSSQKWRALIMADGKYRSLGLFATAELAHAAYVAAAEKYFGEFANTGEPNE